MKKRATALALAAVMALSLAGCGGGSTSASGSGEAQTEAAGEAQNAGGGSTIKIVCPYGVGGTADSIARKWALVANNHSDYNFIVENMTGGDGFQAANWYTDQDPSTTDLLVYGFGVAYRHDLGKQYQTEVVDFDRNDIYPVADIDDRTWIVYAKTGTTLADILDKAKNGGIKMSGGNPLSDPHLALGSLLALDGGTVMTVPYDGGAAQKKGLTDGEVDVFVGTTQAAIEDVEAGTITPILAFSETAFEGFKGPDGAITAWQATAWLPSWTLPKITLAPSFRPAASSRCAPALTRHGSTRLQRLPRKSGQIRSTQTGSARLCSTRTSSTKMTRRRSWTRAVRRHSPRSSF